MMQRLEWNREEWPGSDYLGRKEGGVIGRGCLGAGNVLFLDLVSGYVGVADLELYICVLCIFKKKIIYLFG